MSSGLADAVAAALDTAVTASRPLGGGDNASSARLDLATGSTVFAKSQPGGPPGCLTTEAIGLRWLRDAHRTAGALPVPKVLAVDDGDPAAGRPNVLVLEWIDEGGRGTAAAEAEAGRGIAALHRSGAPAFGRDDRRPTGSRGLPNEPCDTWVEFYATQRLLPLAKLAADEGALPPPVIADLERVATRLTDLGGPPEPPARLHGDLWAGNRVVDRSGRSWLIDPAAHGGHREFDLAMMRLFGGFGPECFSAYDDAFPLADGWPDRVLLHQIAPLVVHAIKFGGGYCASAARAIEQYR